MFSTQVGSTGSLAGAFVQDYVWYCVTRFITGVGKLLIISLCGNPQGFPPFREWLFQSFYFVAAWQRGRIAAYKTSPTLIVAVWQCGRRKYLEKIVIILNEGVSKSNNIKLKLA